MSHPLSREKQLARTASLAFVSLMVSACGSEAAAPAPVPTAPAPVPPVAAAPVAPTPAAPAAAEVPLRDRPLPERIAATTVTIPAPVPQTDGTVTVSAQVCTLDGPAFVGGDSFKTIGPIAWATDGSLYLADSENQVRHYTVQPGAGCALTLDTSLGVSGRLAVGEGSAAGIESIVADAHGHVYVATAMRGTTRITGNHVDYQCNTRGELSVAPDGSVGIAIFGGHGPQLVTFTDAGCTTAAWEPAEAFEHLQTISFLDDQQILVGGQNGSHDPHLARIYNRAGQPQGAAFGDTTDSSTADDHFCNFQNAVLCTHGLCILDANCRSMRVFSGEHAVLGAVHLSDAAGVQYPWVPNVTNARDGVAYMTLNQQRGLASERTGVYDGFVFRLTGL